MMANAIPGVRYTWWTAHFGRTFTNWVLNFFGRVKCDRCKRFVEGYVSNDLTPNEFGGVSAGVYVGWRDMMDIDEWIICDHCMWVDERYLAVYPSQRGAVERSSK